MQGKFLVFAPATEGSGQVHTIGLFAQRLIHHRQSGKNVSFMELSVPFYRQEEEYYCGPAVLQMLFAYLGRHFSQEELAHRVGTTSDHGTRNDRLVSVLCEEKFYCYENDESTAFEIKHYLLLGLPVVVNFIEHSEAEGHYALVTGFVADRFILHDPWHGQGFVVAEKDFISRWHDDPNLRHHPDHPVYERWLLVAAETASSFGKIHRPENGFENLSTYIQQSNATRTN